MKKLIWAFVAIAFISCEKKQNDFVTLSGIVPDQEITTVSVQGKNFSKVIPVENGSFSDTLKVIDGMHVLVFGNKRASVFLKNGYNLNLGLTPIENEQDIVSFTGTGSETNNYLEEKRTFFMSDYGDPKTYFDLDKEAYTARLNEAKQQLKNSKFDASKVDTTVVNLISKSDEMLFSYIETNYEQMYANSVKLGKGKPSPEFLNYENFKGGTTSLADLRGKYVYIDIWATWCGPCKAEIPNLKALEEDFHGKDIHFVSISVDNIDGRRGSHESWKTMVGEKQLGGIQLFADNDFNSQFIRDYNINSIPRFILLDPNGNIVDSNAMRPSSPEIRNYFKELGI